MVKIIKGPGRDSQVAKKTMAKQARLAKAPLVEVVFELHWKLHGDNALFRTDPGVLPLLTTFSAKIGELGFVTTEEMARVEQTIGQSVIRRFRKAPDLAFPIMQIGSGIFASNDGPTYEWEAYRKQVLEGIKVLLDAYPKLPGYPLKPDHLELRYLDSFDETLLQTDAFLEFLSRGTEMVINPPPFLEDQTRFEPNIRGRVLFNARTKGRKSTLFSVDFGTAVHGEGVGFRLESKVVTTGTDVPTLGSPKKFLSDIEVWLEFAHDLTSPFFKSFIAKELMGKFETTAP
jgi:uncharacterized protein (TIGR04255 family)